MNTLFATYIETLCRSQQTPACTPFNGSPLHNAFLLILSYAFPKPMNAPCTLSFPALGTSHTHEPLQIYDPHALYTTPKTTVLLADCTIVLSQILSISTVPYNLPDTFILYLIYPFTSYNKRTGLINRYHTTHKAHI